MAIERWLRQQEIDSENRAIRIKKLNNFIEANPEIRQKYNEVISRIERHGIAATATVAGLVVNPLAIVISLEAFRQFFIGFKKIGELDRLLSEKKLP